MNARLHSLIFTAAIALFLAPVSLPAAAAPKEILLWPNGAPNSQDQAGPETMRIYQPGGDHVITYVNQPSITVYLPPPGQGNGAAVMVIPGGGHKEIWIDHEGYNVARWFSQRGIAAFVVKYRLAKATNSTYTVDGDELGDVQRAIRLVRSRAGEWGVDSHRLGVIGFSAGGELAFLSAMRFDDGLTHAADPIDRQSSRPDFQALMYPGNVSRLEVTTNSPPAFLCCGGADRSDISEGLANAYLKFKQAKVPVELHIFAGIGHGFGIRSSNTGPVSKWPDRFYEWLDQQGFLKQP